MESLQNNYGMRRPARGRDNLLSSLIADIIKTRETREILKDVTPQIVRSWAGTSRIKQKIAGQTERLISSLLTPPKNGHQDITLDTLFEDPDFLTTLTRVLPGVVTGLVESFNAIGRNFEHVSEKDREAFVSDILNGLGKSRLGESLTILVKTANDGYRDNPYYLRDKLGPALVTWLTHLDIGEIRDFLDHSREDIQEIVRMIMDVLWKYPSKLVLLLSFISDAVNTTASSTSEFLTMVNRISPDLLTDVVFSIFRSIDGKAVGRTLNEMCELIRKVHTGSALIGEPGTTQLPTDLTKFLEDVLSVLDGETLWKARTAIAQEQEIVSRVFYNVLKENPERLERRMIRYTSVKNASIRSMNYRLSAVDRLPDKTVAGAVEQGLKNIDTQDAAEVVNQICLLINKLRSLKPDMIEEVATQFIESLDLFEVRESFTGLIDDVSGPLAPLERIMIPKLVIRVCRALEPRDDEYEDDADEARRMIRSLLAAEEVM